MSSCAPTEPPAIPNNYEDVLEAPTSSTELEEYLVITAESGGPILGVAGDMEIGNHDQIYVSDYQSDQIYEYNSVGAYVRTIGGPGDGPGEFQVPVMMRTFGDSLYVFDNRIYRVSVFSQSTGAFVRSWDTKVEGWRAYRLLSVSPQGFVMWYSPSVVDGTDAVDDQLRRVPLDSTDPSDATVIWRTPGTEYIPVEINGMTLHRVKPFGHRSECAFWKSTGYCMYSATLSVHTFSVTGDTLQTFSVHTNPQPVTADDRERALNRIPGESVRAQVMVNDMYPEISDMMIVDDSERIWIRRPDEDKKTVYWVLDPKNESTRSFTIPGDVRIKSIVRGRAVARITHEDNCHSVGVYNIPPPDPNKGLLTLPENHL